MIDKNEVKRQIKLAKDCVRSVQHDIFWVKRDPTRMYVYDPETTIPKTRDEVIAAHLAGIERDWGEPWWNEDAPTAEIRTTFYMHAKAGIQALRQA